MFIAGSVVGLVLGTIFRFFAYRFWVFSAELDDDPEFSSDRELLHVGSEPTTPAAPKADTNPLPPRIDE